MESKYKERRNIEIFDIEKNLIFKNYRILFGYLKLKINKKLKLILIFFCNSYIFSYE